MYSLDPLVQTFTSACHATYNRPDHPHFLRIRFGKEEVPLGLPLPQNNLIVEQTPNRMFLSPLYTCPHQFQGQPILSYMYLYQAPLHIYFLSCDLTIMLLLYERKRRRKNQLLNLEFGLVLVLKTIRKVNKHQSQNFVSCRGKYFSVELDIMNICTNMDFRVLQQQKKQWKSFFFVFWEFFFFCIDAAIISSTFSLR